MQDIRILTLLLLLVWNCSNTTLKYTDVSGSYTLVEEKSSGNPVYVLHPPDVTGQLTLTGGGFFTLTISRHSGTLAGTGTEEEGSYSFSGNTIRLETDRGPVLEADVGEEPGRLTLRPPNPASGVTYIFERM